MEESTPQPKESKDFVGYIGDPDFHDGSVLAVKGQGSVVRVRVSGASGRVYLVQFDKARAVCLKHAEGMKLYALTEFRSTPPLRRFVFANWDDDGDAYLEVNAETVEIRVE